MMTKFRQKQYTIQEGKYTGPKDLDKVPGVMDLVGKSALVGAGLGGVVGGAMKDSSAVQGAFRGGKYGTLAGIGLKLFVNHLHKPMDSIKFNEVDRHIRQEFEIYRMAGITVGDTPGNRARVLEKYSFNDKNIAGYKINIVVHNDRLVLYTYDLSNEELESLNTILDHYCKKFYGMGYKSKPIDVRKNSYSVNITFTNYQAISNFLIEVLENIDGKINLLNSKINPDELVSIEDDEEEEEQKEFSTKLFPKADLIKFFGKIGSSTVSSPITTSVTQDLIIYSLIHGLGNLSNRDLQLSAGTVISGKSGDYNNPFLEGLLKRLHYVERFDYTINKKGAPVNMSLYMGRLMITTSKNSDQYKDLEQKFYGATKSLVSRVEIAKSNVIVYTYIVKSEKELEYIVKRLIDTSVKPNIFEA